MLAMLEKIINEHGSSSILRERLELFSDKYSMLEEKNTHLTERNTDLESQVSSLKEEIEKLQAIVNESANKDNDDLSSMTRQMLQYFFDHSQDLNINNISNALSLEKGVVEHHLDILKDLKYVTHGALMVNQPLTYCISKEGRKYIVEN